MKQVCFDHIIAHYLTSIHIIDEQSFREIQPDDIKIEYHPHSSRKPSIIPFEDYGKREEIRPICPPETSRPWHPWRSRTDFNVAALALDCHMNESQTNKLVELLRHVAFGLDNFSLKGYDEIQKTWDWAAERSTKFQREDIPVTYRGETESVELHYRPVWEWLHELLSNRDITWKCFIHEAWSANQWWAIQSSLLPGAVPLCLVFYADKSKLSSFSTAKGYPVIVRCANLPMNIRNGAGIGGGRVVGWLPIIAEDAAHSGKTDFVNFKNVVWHKSTSKILESLVQYSKTGYTMDCGDEVQRTMFPYILIDSADYEEQCVIALIRGLRGLCPCPKCLIPGSKLSDFSAVYPERTPEETVSKLNRAKQLEITSKAEAEAILKVSSLRPHINSFFSLAHGDPFRALSYDNLHFGDSGLWGDHLFEQHKVHIHARGAATTIDNCFKSFPRWSGLHHFNDGVMKLSFNDGSKHHDISKLFLLAAHNVIHPKDDIAGYTLLKVTRKYLNMSMYSNLDIQATDNMVLGRAAVKAFFDSLSIYISETDKLDIDKPNSWNFIKLHYLLHMYDDIENKGSLRGMSTKPNEKFHGPIRKIYLRRTNFKDTAKQIVRIEHQTVVATVIQNEIDEYDAYYRPGPNIPNDLETPMDNLHFTIGSKLKEISFAELLEKDPVLFARFHIRVSDFMSDLLPTSGIPLPRGQRIVYSATNTIVPYQYLRINYESLDTWHLATDHLRCNPSFHGAPRYDFIIFNTRSGPVFAQLHYMFVCIVEDQKYPIALVQAYRHISHPRSSVDKDLGLLRIRKEHQTELISVQSVIRGAVAVQASEDPLKSNEMLVFDALDGDMFLRVNNAFPGYTVGR
ncbi:hypothetical protein BT96DRAFT_1033699 [Gymnopus androsaceus JB14]|uniref:Uncharacterized protein n=1 Tax=Gymnopus androsaceus JB14 TaxID=1447944 RepID=A0A6A4IB44_9AGAR|nr:hypothetical protein BT96DRAFT_1033699 [Gymnopus androsaceus JB14]